LSVAFVVEDGTGRSDSSSYCDVSFADSYFSDRGVTDWAPATDEQKGAYLIRGTAYLGRWSLNWKGWRANATQALDWPRSGAVLFERPLLGLPVWALALYGYSAAAQAFPSNVIPEQLKQATAEFALRAKDGSLSRDLKRGGRIKERIIGPITTIYADDAPAETTFPDIAALIAPLLNDAGGGGVVNLVRG
jgi:hypothetical protein